MSATLDYESIPCGRCEAAIGEPCKTITGRRADNHSARCWPLSAAWRVGYHEGLTDAHHDPAYAARHVAKEEAS